MVKIMWQDGSLNDNTDYGSVEYAFKKIKQVRGWKNAILSTPYDDSEGKNYEVYQDQAYSDSHPNGDSYSDTIVRTK